MNLSEVERLGTQVKSGLGQINVTVLRFNDVYILNEKYIGMYVKFFAKALASGTLVISNPQ